MTIHSKNLNKELHHVCDICGKARSGWVKVNHSKCSKIRKERRDGRD